MKKIFAIIIIIIFILVLYLNRSYANIYNSISYKNLNNPTTNELFMSLNNQKEKIKIAFLGDSLTAGVGASEESKTFPRLIASKLVNNYQVEILNLGVPGAKTKDVLLSQVSRISDFKPDKVVLFIGINDLHDRIGVKIVKENLEKIIADLKISKNNLYLVNIPYLGNRELFLLPFQKYFLSQTKKYNQIFADLKTEGWTVIDLYEGAFDKFRDNTDVYASDNFHPNDSGYQIFANIIYKAMF